MVVDSSQNAQIIVDLYDTRIEKTIGFNAKGKGFNRGSTTFAYGTRNAFASVTQKALIKEREERLAKEREIAKGRGFNRGDTAFAYITRNAFASVTQKALIKEREKRLAKERVISARMIRVSKERWGLTLRAEGLSEGKQRLLNKGTRRKYSRVANVD